jgi:AbrB family looped-hinge helix DNA binding protein
MATSTLSSKGQITIPKQVREFLNLSQSDELVFTPLEEGKVLLTVKAVPPSALFGLLKHRKLSAPVSIETMKTAIKSRRQQRNRP